MELQQKKDEALKVAFGKICSWCKENCAGKFAEGRRFDSVHHVYYWLSLVINEEGDAMIYRGNHSSDSPTEVVTASHCYNIRKSIYSNNVLEKELGEASRNFYRDAVEEVVLGWQRFKAMILTELENERLINNFEV